MKIIITIVLMVSFNANANAGWFDFGSKSKSLSQEEMVTVKRGICGCYISANNDHSAHRAAVRPLMAKMNDSLITTYNPGEIKCDGWDNIPNETTFARKTCISVYNTYGDDRALKGEADTMLGN